jgi:hypothetical protein
MKSRGDRTDAVAYRLPDGSYEVDRCDGDQRIGSIHKVGRRWIARDIFGKIIAEKSTLRVATDAVGLADQKRADTERKQKTRPEIIGDEDGAFCFELTHTPDDVHAKCPTGLPPWYLSPQGPSSDWKKRRHPTKLAALIAAVEETLRISTATLTALDKELKNPTV